MDALPADLTALCDSNKAMWRRDDHAALDRILAELKIAPGSEFGRFLHQYTLQLWAPITRDVLSDPVDPGGDLNGVIPWAWDLWEVPRHYVAISSLEGEGGYFYDTVTGGVVDFELSDMAFVPVAGGFFDFIAWYLSDAPEPRS